MSTKIQRYSWLDSTYLWLLVGIFGLIVLYAPLTVGLSTLFPHYELLIKSWEEVVMAVAVVFGVIVLSKHRQFGVLKRPLFLLIALFFALHFLVLFFAWHGVKQTLAGLLIDLRYLSYFTLVYVALILYPARRRLFLRFGLIGALVVTVFALLQITVLPKDILSYIGYTKENIAPYLTVDMNKAFIRVNSTMRGPNPLGAYASLVLCLLAAYVVRGKLQKTNCPQIIAGVLAAASVVSVWVSYSRSAVIGAVIGVVLVFLIAYGRHIAKKWWVIGAIVIVVCGVGLMALRHNNVISSLAFHQNLDGGSSIDSDEGHLWSLEYSIKSDAAHPLGVGVGSTGSASLYGKYPDVIENQYLFDMHEAGWLAGITFIAIYVVILRDMWRRRADWLSLGLFTSGIGLGIIGLMLPVWADDTVAIVWWGLAAVAIASPVPIMLKSRHYGTNTAKLPGAKPTKATRSADTAKPVKSARATK